MRWIVLLLLILGCIGQPEEHKIKISDVLKNPDTYRDKIVEINSTLIKMSPYTGGSIFILKDETGEIMAIYDGTIYPVDLGYRALFKGRIIQDRALAGAHASGVILAITGIKNIIPGKIEAKVEIPKPLPKIPKIAEFLENILHYSQGEVTLIGKCIYSIDAGGYTYVEIEDETGKVWVAVPETEAPVNKTVKVKGIVMRDFSSKALGKTFDVIIFSTGLEKL